jgi:hypothetical protein
MLAMMRERGDRAEFEATDDRLRHQAAGTLIGDPLSHQKSRQDMALRRALLFDGPDGGPQYVRPGPQSTVGGYMAQNLPRYDSAKPFFTNEAMAAGERPFWESIGGLTQGQVGPNLGAVGYGNAGGGVQGGIDASNAARQSTAQAAGQARTNDQANTQSAVMSALGGGANGAAGQTQQKKGGGFWKTLGNIGLMAAPFVAAPFTGGSSLAMLGIGAGTGAARGLLNGGGAKGALTGAATGAATTYAGNVISGALGGQNANFVKKAVGQTAKRLNKAV